METGTVSVGVGVGIDGCCVVNAGPTVDLTELVVSLVVVEGRGRLRACMICCKLD